MRDRRPARRRRGQRAGDRHQDDHRPVAVNRRRPGASHCVTIQTGPREGGCPWPSTSSASRGRRRRGGRAAVRRPLAPARPPLRAAGARPGRRRGRRAGRVRRDARQVVAAARPRQGAGLPAPGRGEPLPLGAAAPRRRRAARADAAHAGEVSGGRASVGGARRDAVQRRAAPALRAAARGARAAALPRLVGGADRRRARHLAAARSRHTHTEAAPPCASCSATGGRTDS